MWMLILTGYLTVLLGADSTCEVLTYEIHGKTGRALLCRPEGKGLFPVVVYNHGAIVDFRGYEQAHSLGYDMQGMALALAREGFLVFAPIRQSGRGNLPSHLAEIHQAIAYLKTLPQADTTRMALMGFSRGGALTLRASLQDEAFRAVILEAPALHPDRVRKLLAETDSLKRPYLLLIEKSDNPRFLRAIDTLNALLLRKGAQTTLIRYDRGGGHRLFWKVDYYWDDVKKFLQNIKKYRTPSRSPAF